jgi:hypothetical protein
MFPSDAPTKRDANLQSLFYISCRFSSKGVLPTGFPHRAPSVRDAPLLETPSSISQSPW